MMPNSKVGKVRTNMRTPHLVFQIKGFISSWSEQKVKGNGIMSLVISWMDKVEDRGWTLLGVGNGCE